MASEGDLLLYILWGRDAFSREEKLKEIKAGLGDASLLSTNLHLLEGDQVTPEGLASIGQTAPFLSPKRLIIINGLLDRFEPADRPQVPRKGGQAKIEEAEKIARCLKGLPETTVVVMQDTIESRKSPLKNNPLYQLLAGQAETIPFPALNAKQLFQWVQDRTAAQGGSISRQATSVLLDLVGSDLFALQHEIEKLAAFSAGRMAEEKDVRAVAAAAQESNVFSLVDAMMDNLPSTAERLLEDLLKHGQNPSQIIGALARQVQSILLVREMKLQKRPSSEIQVKTGLMSQFAYARVSARAVKFNLAKLKEIYRKLLEADLSIKTGKAEGELVLELLVADLSRRP